MNCLHQDLRPAETPSAAARRRFLSREGAPLLLADWEHLVMLHFEIDAKLLQRTIPFELDLFDGRAFVSLVTFTMRRMRLAFGGRLTRGLCALLGEQRFLNVRTYVRQGEETGIHFITEWISNALCVPFGPLAYGLPYRWGRLDFRPGKGDALRGRVESRFGRVAQIGEGRARRSARADGRSKSQETGADSRFAARAERRALPFSRLMRIWAPSRFGGGAFDYEARPVGNKWAFAECEPGSLREFLVERYTGFTRRGNRRRRFRIWHESWRMAEAEAEWSDDSLLRQHLPWWGETRYVGANYSAGAHDIWMGRPHLAYSR